MSLSVGFIYVLADAAMPGLVKVGLSKHLAEDRARQLSTTGVALPFDMVHRCVTSHPREVGTASS